MVYEPLGMSLYDLIKKNDYKRFPLDLVRTVALQILKGIDFLESMNLIHTGESCTRVCSVKFILFYAYCRLEAGECSIRPFHYEEYYSLPSRSCI